MDVDSPASIPRDFVCPISREIMEHPTINEAGNSYEYLSIAEWFALGHRTDPLSGVAIRNPTLLIPNRSLKSQIEDWKKGHPKGYIRREMQKGDFEAAIHEFEKRHPRRRKERMQAARQQQQQHKKDTRGSHSVENDDVKGGIIIGDVLKFNIITVGDAAAGKSCLLHRYAKNTFNKLLPFTCGAEHYFKKFKLGEKTIILDIVCDTDMNLRLNTKNDTFSPFDTYPYQCRHSQTRKHARRLHAFCMCI